MQKVKIIEVFNYIDNNNLDIEVVNLVHDEILFDTDDIKGSWAIKHILEDFPEFDVKFSAGLEIGKTWSHSKEYDNLEETLADMTDVNS
jgi:DNA polymerase I-like protein with 3'-5' exonuclease and polymerase domains